MIQVRYSIIIFLLLLSSKYLQAQDLHFSQFFNAPLLTNPANTGFIPDADFRLGVNYRNQYSSIMAQPYKTYSAWGDVQLFRNKIENGWLGIGGVLLGDKVGSGSLTSNKLYGSIAYHQMLGESSLLSAGFNIGYVSKRIDNTKLTFPDQFDGKFFDRRLPTAVSFANVNIDYIDVQTGLNYAYFPDENIYVNAGYSIHHVNRPKETFFNDLTNDGRVPMRHIAFVNAILKPSERVIVNPNVYYSNQANASELVLGLNAHYNLSQAGETQVLGGLYYRWKDAIVPVVGLEVKNFKVTYSFDATLSNLRQFNGGRGAHEISIVKKGIFPENEGRPILCPRF